MRRVTEGEKRAWLRVLRGHVRLTRAVRHELADLLEQYFYPETTPKKPGPKPESQWERAGKQFWTIICEAKIQEEVDRIEAAGEQPPGGPREAAKEKVAGDIDLTLEALQKRLTRAKSGTETPE